MTINIATFAAASGGSPLTGAGKDLIITDPGSVGASTTVTCYLENIGDTTLAAGALVYAVEPVGYHGTNDPLKWRNDLWWWTMRYSDISINGGAFEQYTPRLPAMIPGDPRVRIDVRFTAATAYHTDSFPSALAMEVEPVRKIRAFESFDLYDPAETFLTNNWCMGGRPTDIFVDSVTDTFLATRAGGGQAFHAYNQNMGFDYVYKFLSTHNSHMPYDPPDSTVAGMLVRPGTGVVWTHEGENLLQLTVSATGNSSSLDAPLALLHGPSGSLVLKQWDYTSGFVTVHTFPSPFAGPESEVYVELGCVLHHDWDVEWAVWFNGSLAATGTYTQIGFHDSTHRLHYVQQVSVGAFYEVPMGGPFTVDQWISKLYMAEVGTSFLTAHCYPFLMGHVTVTADGSFGDLTTLHGAATQHEAVDDVPEDSDTTYISVPNGTLPPRRSTFSHDPLPGGTLLAAQPTAYTKNILSIGTQDNAAAGYLLGTLRDISQAAWVGAQTTYAMSYTCLKTNPWTQAPLTVSDVNSMEVGVLVWDMTGTGSSLEETRCTQVAIEYMIVPPTSLTRLWGAVIG